jgi:ABC-type Zn uptake system ZnuABC Zn-binding protein ZnuA
MRIVAALLALAALSAAPRPLVAAEKLRVSSLSTVLTEIAEQVGGVEVIVTGHVRPGVDPHSFEPSPEDLQVIASADLILISSHHMESSVEKLRANVKGRVVEIGATVLQTGSNDPHWWQSIPRVQQATRIVRDALAERRPAAQTLFTANAAQYLEKLDALARWARREIATLPRDRRKLVTSHDAFQYFARDFGFTIYAIEGISTADEPSSQHVSEIIRIVKEQGVKAIFTEEFNNPKVVQEIVRATGARLGGKLYADGLAEGEASTFAGMYRHNVTTIVEGLK